MPSMENAYNRERPFLAKITERYSLSKPGSKKKTMHLVIDISGSNMRYFVGDSLAVCPKNDPELVKKTLAALKMSGEEEVVDRHGKTFSLLDYLSSHANLKSISKKFVQTMAEKGHHAELNVLLASSDFKEKLLHHEVWDFLLSYPDITLVPQEIIGLLLPLLPRFYSIASAQAYVGDEIHLTVAYLDYESAGIRRLGACTHYLCSLAPLNSPEVPVYIHPSHDFRPPEDIEKPIIMIGPGTGVAPFRAFMQERDIKGHKGKNWLFFGEWTRENEFFYEEEWMHWSNKDQLKLSLAFSRDQKEKVYVQHKMLEHAKELFRWLEEGAFLYVCGDAQHMAKDVEKMLHMIVMEEGAMGEAEAHEYIKRLRKEKRYLRDVY